MCTAITYKTKDHYFGRNLDLDYSYEETVTITPRNFPLKFRHVPHLKSHYALIGMAYIAEDYPLYYEATNEKGLSIAGLNFPENAHYREFEDGMDNIAVFEIIPWILCQCADIDQACSLLSRINVIDEAFSETLPPATLHWIISDRNRSITVEPVKDGLKIYDNPVEVLTNNPTFDMQLFNLNNYMHLTTKDPVNTFAKSLNLSCYSRGMGGLGLPGDCSSASRFVKAAFTKMNSVSGNGESESVSQFFHILGSAAQQRGCTLVNDRYEYTIYSSCCNTDKGIYYYTTYENSQITAVDMRKENLNGSQLIYYNLIKGQQIREQN